MVGQDGSRGTLSLQNLEGSTMKHPPAGISGFGMMALTERIVLFGDRSPLGPGHPEVYGSGLSAVRGAVLLPHARTRLLLDDRARMAVFARRFAPARCVLLEAGTRIDLEDGSGCPPGTRVLGDDGHVTALEAA
jgi:hypothetical protein